jgi:hypothetical protein
MRNRRVPPVAQESQLQPPSTAADVKLLSADAMVAVRAGILDPKRGTTLALMANQLLKSIELADLEARLTRLEQENSDETSEAY